MSDGSYLCAGSVGWQIWPAERRKEAEQMGLSVRPHQMDADSIIVGGHKVMFVQRSNDKGKTWMRREWHVPGFRSFQVYQMPQSALMDDDTVLFVCYGPYVEGERYATYVWRSADQAKAFRLIPMGSHSDGVHRGETAFLEVSPGRIFSLSRCVPDPGFMVQQWSEDGGLSWSYPVRVDF